MLGGLAPEQGAPSLPAAIGNAGDNRGDAHRVDRAGGDVVGHEERLCAADDKVIDDHRDEVDADGVVNAEGAGHRNLRADPVGGRGEERPAIAGEGTGIEEARESPEPADGLGPLGRLDRGPHEGDRAFTGLDIDAGRRVARRPLRLARHGRPRASWAPRPTVAWTPSISTRASAATRRSMPSMTCLPMPWGSGI